MPGLRGGLVLFVDTSGVKPVAGPTSDAIACRTSGENLSWTRGLDEEGLSRRSALAGSRRRYARSSARERRGLDRTGTHTPSLFSRHLPPATGAAISNEEERRPRALVPAARARAPFRPCAASDVGLARREGGAWPRAWCFTFAPWKTLSGTHAEGISRAWTVRRVRTTSYGGASRLGGTRGSGAGGAPRRNSS